MINETKYKSAIKIPDVKIIVGKSEIIFKGKKEVLISELANVYLKLENYLRSNGYFV